MQTTKGIWISRGQGMKALVMDVEGTDGRERGEDQVKNAKSQFPSLLYASFFSRSMGVSDLFRAN